MYKNKNWINGKFNSRILTGYRLAIMAYERLYHYEWLHHPLSLHLNFGGVVIFIFLFFKKNNYSSRACWVWDNYTQVDARRLVSYLISYIQYCWLQLFVLLGSISKLKNNMFLLIVLIFPGPATSITCLHGRIRCLYSWLYSGSVTNTAEKGKVAKTRDEEQCVLNTM